MQPNLGRNRIVPSAELALSNIGRFPCVQDCSKFSQLSYSVAQRQNLAVEAEKNAPRKPLVTCSAVLSSISAGPVFCKLVMQMSSILRFLFLPLLSAHQHGRGQQCSDFSHKTSVIIALYRALPDLFSSESSEYVQSSERERSRSLKCGPTHIFC